MPSSKLKRKEDILRLRKEGKSYNEIKEILGCSKSTISYHCGDGSEKKRAKQSVKHRPSIIRKISAFRARTSKEEFDKQAKQKKPQATEKVRIKTKTFKRAGGLTKKTHGLVNNIAEDYSYKDVLDKIGENPKCYLTGDSIDLSDSSSYQLDHIVPTSKGGTNDLSNLQICTKQANIAKSNLSLDELKMLCKKILKHTS
jgi:5-methylcytosine-specific restriction endonuclease McrA